MYRLHLFNTSNDLALANNSHEYIAPKNIRRMERDLSMFPAWWASDGDAILIDSDCNIEEIKKIAAQANINVELTTEHEGYTALCRRTGKEYAPAPWGWSRAAVERFAKAGVPRNLLPDGKTLDALRDISSRAFAVKYIHELLGKIAEEYRPHLVGSDMRFIENLDTLTFPRRQIFKSPWSSSGRGVFTAYSIDDPSIREKLTAFINRQGGFVADTFYNKRIDFALEYNIDEEGKATFLGYSVFTASESGSYGYNILASQNELRKCILDAGANKNALDAIISLHRQMLQEKLGCIYRGNIGIDMLIAEEQGALKIHPCIEINLRMNIGTAAIHIYNKVGSTPTLLTPSGKNGFYAMTDGGRLKIEYRG